MPSTSSRKRSRSGSKKYSTKRYRPYKSLRYRQAGLYAPSRKPQEIKSMDTGPSSTLISTTAAIVPINLMYQGNADYERVGSEVAMKSVLLRAHISLGNTHDNASELIRFMIVYDRAPNGFLPTFSQIVQDTDILGSVQSTVLSAPNPDNRDRFLILMDKTYGNPLDSSAANTSNHVIATRSEFPSFISKWIPLNNLLTKYKASANSISAITLGALYFVHIGLNSPEQANFYVTYNTRVKYTDS